MHVFAHAQEKFWKDTHKTVSIGVFSRKEYRMESDGERNFHFYFIYFCIVDILKFLLICNWLTYYENVFMYNT